MKKGIIIPKSEKRFRYTGLAILVCIVCASVFAPALAPYPPYDRTGRPFEPLGKEHILGCNDIGQDLFSEILYGGRISLFIGFFAAFYATIVGTILALAAGYYGGGVDRLVMRFVDIILTLPYLPLVIVLGTFMGAGIGTQIMVISVVMWAHPCRELRSQVMKIRSSGYIDASRAMGERSPLIILRHVLPELIPLIVPQFVRIVQTAIMIESSLSFLGLGDPVLKSWGSILFFANTRAAFLTGSWVNWVLPPGLCITLTVLAFSFIGFSLGGKAGISYSSLGSFLLHRSEQPRTGKDEGNKLTVNNLTTIYNSQRCRCTAVNKVSVNIPEGQMLALVGESGCGKSTLAMSILGLLRYPTQVTSGVIMLNGHDLLSLDKSKLVKLRGKRMAYIPQNAMNSLNPVISIENQIIEAVQIHQKIPKKEAAKKAREVLKLVEMPAARLKAYNHELSGGMKQRVVIAMALVNNPEFLIADEPTTGLDVLVQQEILKLLCRLKTQLRLSVLFITHDLPIVMQYADKIAVMYNGKIVDTGSVSNICKHPSHAHTRALVENFPHLYGEKRWLRAPPNYRVPTVLCINEVTKTFRAKHTGFTKRLPVRAVKKISLSIQSGEVVGLIGGSGCGKSTIARMIVGLEEPDSGSIVIDGKKLTKKAEKKEILKNVHLVFQDPYHSMRNKMRIIDIVAEPLKIHGHKGKQSLAEKVKSALREVNLPDTDIFLHRTPEELSGGQRQRLSFARAIISQPKLIIADEPTSMLDVSLRTELLTVMEKLRANLGIAFLFITHDLALARHFCDRMFVLDRGTVVETGNADTIIFNPKQFYTKSLIEAAQSPGINTKTTYA